MVAALVIADGKTAFGDSLEPYKEIGAIPAIRRIVMVFQRAGIDRVVVVCNECDDKGGTYKHAPTNMNVVFLHDHADGEMLDYVKTGLIYLQDKREDVMITPSNLPLFSVETVRALMAAKGDVCVPSHKGRAGHPMLLRAKQFDAVLSYTGEGGLSGAIKASGLQCNFVEVNDEGILADVLQNNYLRLIDGHSLRESQADAKIRIVRERPFYGPGAHLLLQLIDETKSVREACRRMNMSYTKGRGILVLMEQQLGYPVIVSQVGGPIGSYTVVTEKGKELMSKYADFCAEAKECLNKLFQKHFAR
jgi:molybdate transport repressor ModE-like protein